MCTVSFGQLTTSLLFLSEHSCSLLVCKTHIVVLLASLSKPLQYLQLINGLLPKNTKLQQNKETFLFWLSFLLMGGPGERKAELTYEELEARREIKRKRDREYRSKRREMQHSQPSCTLCGAVGVPLH